MVVRDGKLVKQSDIVREAVKAGEWKKALRIAKDFRINVTKAQRDAMASMSAWCIRSSISR